MSTSSSSANTLVLSISGLLAAGALFGAEAFVAGVLGFGVAFCTFATLGLGVLAGAAVAVFPAADLSVSLAGIVLFAVRALGECVEWLGAELRLLGAGLGLLGAKLGLLGAEFGLLEVAVKLLGVAAGLALATK